MNIKYTYIVLNVPIGRPFFQGGKNYSESEIRDNINKQLTDKESQIIHNSTQRPDKQFLSFWRSHASTWYSSYVVLALVDYDKCISDPTTPSPGPLLKSAIVKAILCYQDHGKFERSMTHDILFLSTNDILQTKLLHSLNLKMTTDSVTISLSFNFDILAVKKSIIEYLDDHLNKLLRPNRRIFSLSNPEQLTIFMEQLDALKTAISTLNEKEKIVACFEEYKNKVAPHQNNSFNRELFSIITFCAEKIDALYALSLNDLQNYVPHNYKNTPEFLDNSRPLSERAKGILNLANNAANVYIKRCETARLGLSWMRHMDGMTRARDINSNFNANKDLVAKLETLLCTINQSIENGEYNQRSGLNDALLYMFDNPESKISTDFTHSYSAKEEPKNQLLMKFVTPIKQMISDLRQERIENPFSQRPPH